jgi:hypothetical protein
MLRGHELDNRVYDETHIAEVLTEIRLTFPTYFLSFCQLPLRKQFQDAIGDYEAEQLKYSSYLDPEALDEFEDNPNSFKGETKKNCPIIRRCLNSKEEYMKAYQRSFSEVKGRDLLNAARKIAEFGRAYVSDFDHERHENARSFAELGIAPLDQPEYGCPGVIGYGIQSALLYGQYPHAFAHRSQNAVWSLYFLTSRKSFGLKDDSEFMMVQPEYNTCDQNYFYPADLFGFYALRLFLMLKAAFSGTGLDLEKSFRYIYLSSFCDHVAEQHKDDIAVFKWSSDRGETFWT